MTKSKPVRAVIQPVKAWALVDLSTGNMAWQHLGKTREGMEGTYGLLKSRGMKFIPVLVSPIPQKKGKR